MTTSNPMLPLPQSTHSLLTEMTLMAQIFHGRIMQNRDRTGPQFSLAYRLGGLVIVLVAGSFAAAQSGTADEPELLKAPFDRATARDKQLQWAKYLKRKVVETNSIGIKLALVPPGEFMMGSPEEEKFFGKHNPEEKQHRVRITKPFYLGVYDVTLGNYLTFYHAAGYKTESETDGKGGLGYDSDGNRDQKPEYTFRSWGLAQTNDHPVVNVSWNDAKAFCVWLSRKEGKQYRLPTEAEWEFACRAGTTTRYNFGSSLNGHSANCDGHFPFGTQESGPDVGDTTPVGSYQSNRFGLYDMHGNAAQWCQDWYGEDYYAKSPTDDPPGPSAGSYRVIRGCGWNGGAVFCLTSARLRSEPSGRTCYTGFRVVCER